MGTLTLTELKDEVRAALGNRTDLNSRLTRFLNLAQQRLARIYDFEELQGIQEDTFTYNGTNSDKTFDLPTGFRDIYAIKVIDGLQSLKLEQIPQRRWNKVIPAPQALARDRPRMYSIWGLQAQLWPLPNAAYDREIWYTRWPTALSDSTLTATSDYKEKDEVLIELALVYAYNSLGKVEEAQAHWSRARGLLLEAVNTDSDKPDIDFRPGPGTEAVQAAMPGEYWNDPFIRQVP